MTTTPKAVILAVVVFLGLIVLCVIAGSVVLQLTGNGPMPSDIQNLGLVALGALAGVLATTRTTPELPPGAQLTGGATSLTTPTIAQNAGETASGVPVAAPAAPAVPAATTASTATSGLVTLEAQGIDPALGQGGGAPPKNANAAGG